MALGIALGAGLVQRHPEYAMALVREYEQGHDFGDAIDNIVESCPIELAEAPA
jgi:hypothetical protein